MWTSNDENRIEVSGRMNGTSNVVALDERAIAAAMPAPSVANLNVTKSSKVHIGPKFVSVTQNVQNAETVKGKFLCLDLVTTKKARRLRCSAIVFILCALIVTTSLIIYVLYLTRPTKTRIDIGLNETWFLRREDWQAMPAYEVEFLVLPLGHVIIGHAAGYYCNKTLDCIEQMKIIQQDHLRRDYYDIGPNFLIGGNGDIFEGRGANVFGGMVKSHNRISEMIMFLGNYVVNKTDPLQFIHTQILLERLVEIGVLRPDYVLLGQCQVRPDTVPPGPNIMDSINFFPHWNPEGKDKCIH